MKVINEVAELINQIPERVRYKVLTQDRKSTGLQHSKIVKYRLHRWNYSWHNIVIYGKCGEGGLWASRNKAMARALQKYLARKKGMKADIYLCIIDQTLFESSYRTKTNRLYLLDKIA